MVLRRRRKFDHPGGDASAHGASLLPQGGPVPTGWDVPAAFNFTRDVIEAYAARDALRKGVAYIDHEGIVDRRTFTDVAKDAARWAHLLRARLDPGDRVLVVLGKVPAWHGAMLGALKGGLVAVPCSDMLRARDLAYRVRHSGARLVIADRSSEAEVEEMVNQVDGGVAVIYLDDARAELQQYVPRAPTEETAADDPALILYTSGTTKEPKGVVHTHAYTWAQRAQAAHWLDATEQDVIWCTAGSGWAKSIWNVLLGPWSHGAEVVVHQGEFDPEERLSLIERLGVTVLCQAPTEYRMLAKLEELQTAYLPKLRHAVSAGEPLDPEVIERFEWALGLTIHDGYGQTENSLLVANAPGTPVRAGSMGLPTPGHDVAVIDESGYVCPPGVEGDIALKGRPPTMFSGYWDAPDETEAVFRDGWYITGDRATRDDEGYLWFVGRADDVILSAAYRIGPFEVESALLEHPAVAESAVIGVPHPERGQIVKAFVVLRPGREGDAALAAELQEHAKAITAPYKYPRSIEFVDELPKTASGKIRRSELRALPHVEEPVESSVVPLPVRRRDEVAEAPVAGAAGAAAADTQAGDGERGRAEDEARRIAEAAEVIRRKAEEAAQLETELVALRAAKEQAEAEAVAARQAEEARRQAEAEETARLEAAAVAAATARLAEEARLQAEAEEEARLEASAAAAASEAEEARLRADAEEAARLEAAAAAAREADEVRLRAEAEETARLEAAAAQANEAEQARLRAEAEETARLEAEEAARLEAAAAAAREVEERAGTEAQGEVEEETRPEDEEALRREAEEHARAEAEEIARVEAEIAMHREAAERARLEARAAEAFRRAAEAQSLEEPTIAVGEPTSTPTPTPTPELTGRAARRAARESEKAAKAEAKRVAEEEKRRRQEEEESEKRAAEEAERRAKEEAVLAKQRAKEEAEQAKRDAQTAAQRAKDEAVAAERRAKEEAEQAKQRAKEEAEQAKQRAKEEAEQAKRDAQTAAQRAKDEAVAAGQRAKEEEEQRQREEAASREEARRREAEEQAAAKREREKQKKGRGELTRLLLGGDDPGAEFTDDGAPVAPIPGLVERLQQYSRPEVVPVPPNELFGAGAPSREPEHEDVVEPVDELPLVEDEERRSRSH